MGLLLWFGGLPLGVSGQWLWLRRAGPLPLDKGAAVALCALGLAALVVLDRIRAGQVPSRMVTVLLLVLILLAGTLALLGVALEDVGYWVVGPLALISDTSMGYYAQAVQLSGPADAFAYQLERSSNPALPDRVRTHPPGPILFFYYLHKSFQQTPRLLAAVEDRILARVGLTAQQFHRAASSCTGVAALSVRDALIAVPVTLLLTALPVLLALPVFGIGAAVYDRRVGLLMALLAVCLPSLLHFAPSIDGLGAILALIFVWLWLEALKRRHWWLYVAASLAAALMLLWSFGFAILLGLALFVALPTWGRAYPDELRWHLRGAGLAIAVFGLLHWGLYLWSGYNILVALPVSLQAHREILHAAGRTYWIWLPMNLYDFLLFLGPALATVVVVSTYQGLTAGRWPALAHSMVIAVIAILVLLVISGSTRAEVGRIWLFLMPLVALPAAEYTAKLTGARLMWLGTALVLLQVLFAVVLHATLVPVSPF